MSQSDSFDANVIFLGTIYVVDPDSEKLIVSGKSTETVLTSSIGIPQPLEKLSIEEGATVKISSNLRVDELMWSETSADEVCKLIVAGGSKLTVTTLGNEHKGVSCNIEVEDKATLESETLLLAGAAPQLDVAGTLDLTSLTLYDKGILNVYQTASLQVSSLILNSWSVTDMQTDAVLSLDNFNLGYQAEIKFHHDDVEFVIAEKFEMESKSILSLLGTKKNVGIVAHDVVIQDLASIDVSEGGYTSGTGAGSATVGASHGGEGGGNKGTTYGSTKAPDAAGSGSSISGGGKVSIETNTITIDGSIRSDGKTGSSGGSILIKASESVGGHGVMSAVGGDGNTNGGGGGRIAIVTTLFSDFHGKVIIHGGSGSDQPGAAGTVYEEFTKSGILIKNLVVNNDGKETDAVTRVTDVDDLTELKITGKSKVVFDQNEVAIRKVNGDYSGVLTLKQSQTMEIAKVYGTTTAYALQLKLVVPEGSSVVLPSKVLLKDEDTGSDSNNLEVGGNVSGLQELIVATGGRAIINSTSRTGTEPVGTFSLNKLDVTTKGKLFLATDTEDKYTLKVVNALNVKFGGILTGRYLYITTTTILQVAYNGSLNVDGGSEAGGPGNGVNGAGGSHGGEGGASEAGVESSQRFTGELHAATEKGSVGGEFDGSDGGFGGGILEIDGIETLTLNGKISADGKDGTGGAGGGSGGAVSITDIEDVTGSGSISVKGGSSDSGGGGGGGRIRFVVSGDMNYEGSYEIQGGSSTTGGAGGSGTASVNYTQAGTIRTLLELFIDNSDVAGADGAIDGKTFIDFPGKEFSEVDNLNVGDNTTAHIMTENLLFKAKTLICGSGSTVIVDDNVIFSADTEEDYSVLFCSFDLYTSGELRFPPTVELKGENNQLKGNYLTQKYSTFSSLHYIWGPFKGIGLS